MQKWLPRFRLSCKLHSILLLLRTTAAFQCLDCGASIAELLESMTKSRIEEICLEVAFVLHHLGFPLVTEPMAVLVVPGGTMSTTKLLFRKYCSPRLHWSERVNQECFVRSIVFTPLHITHCQCICPRCTAWPVYCCHSALLKLMDA